MAREFSSDVQTAQRKCTRSPPPVFTLSHSTNTMYTCPSPEINSIRVEVLFVDNVKCNGVLFHRVIHLQTKSVSQIWVHFDGGTRDDLWILDRQITMVCVLYPEKETSRLLEWCTLDGPS
jgi:hypothetical protein